MARLGCGSGSLIIPNIRPNKSCGCITRNPLPAASLMRGERLVPEPVGVSFSVCAADSVKDVHACSSRHGASNLFRMRVLRVFFVAAQFPVDRNYRRGNMKCKARQVLCRTDSCTVTLCLLSTTDSYIVTFWPTSALASPLQCAHTKNIPVNP